MSIDGCIYKFFRGLHWDGVLPRAPRVLELGETHFDSSVPLIALELDAKQVIADPERRAELIGRLEAICREGSRDMLHAVARVFWDVFLGPSELVSVDFAGTDRAVQHDLNEVFDLGRRFDVVMNLGTAEHIFDTTACFRSMHAHVEPGGFLIHQAPFTPFFGWYDHGFYNYNPTLWQDLAAANGYLLTQLHVAEYEVDGRRLRQLVQVDGFEALKDRIYGADSVDASTLLLVMQRVGDSPFKVPTQGFYTPERTGWPSADETATAARKYLASKA